ncbi:spermidine/putrescine ABC transporter permease PotC [Opitutaceae bacterium EW11]|nr:spermidine/putrescine ABC transporter permease PotC [Opitutaceae bacterium EW11]
MTALKLLNAFLGAWTLAVFAFLYVPIAVLVVYSFNESRLNIIWQGFTTRWYTELLHNAPLLTALKNSLLIAVFTTFFAIVLGTAGAWLLYRYQFRATRLIHALVSIPMIMPEIIIGISLLIFFTTVSLSLGFTTVVISHVTFCFPFVLVAVQARLQGLDPSLEEAALDLGATPFQAFWRIIVPNLRPAIVSGGLMAFTLSMDELIVTFFTTSAKSATLPIRVFGMAKIGLNPMLNALSAVLILATIASMLFSGNLKKLVMKSA